MSYSEVRNAWEQIDPERLGKDDAMYRWYLMMFLFEIYGCLDSMSHSYREMLKLQQGREAKRTEPIKPQPQPQPQPQPAQPKPSNPPAKVSNARDFKLPPVTGAKK